MADLSDVERRIAELKEEIEPIQKEIEALEGVARALRALEKGERITYWPQRDFSALTMPETAEQILLEVAPKALHYREITSIALARGFKGKRTDLSAPRERIAASFRRMMAQKDPEIFEATGKGYFRISEKHLQGKVGVGSSDPHPDHK